MKDVGIFYGHLVHFAVFSYILWTFGTYRSWKFGIFFPFWYFVRRKIWQPCATAKVAVRQENRRSCNLRPVLKANSVPERGTEFDLYRKKRLFSLRDIAVRLRSQRPLHVQGVGDAGHPC
jgi:hypothetical protein